MTAKANFTQEELAYYKQLIDGRQYSQDSLEIIAAVLIATIRENCFPKMTMEEVGAMYIDVFEDAGIKPALPQKNDWSDIELEGGRSR
jgi:hypothetical protein